MARGDIAAVIEVGRTAPGIVVFNSKRNAVQLWACNGKGVVASITIRDQNLVTLAAANLPDANVQRASVALRVATTRDVRFGATPSLETLIRQTSPLAQQ
jgi:hypothetical protein